MDATLLIIDDDDKLRALLEKYLTSQGFRVLSASSAIKGRQLLNTEKVDALVLDVMMPKEDGFQMAERLSLQGDSTPILFLTAATAPEDRIKGLELGGQDYLPKPFEPKELALRLKNIINRSSSRKVTMGKQNIVSFGHFSFDLNKCFLKKNDESLHLTDLEKHLMYALAKHANRPLSREKLAQTNIGSISDRTVDVQVARLRRKIEPNPKNPIYIQTVRHRGYVLITEPAG